MWKQLPPIAKFSVIAFVIALIIALLSMGAEGFGIYYAVSFALPVSIDTLHGDIVWPTIILAGMAWSPGFLIAGWICMRIRTNKFNISMIYGVILWAWAYVVWYALLTFKVVQ